MNRSLNREKALGGRATLTTEAGSLRVPGPAAYAQETQPGAASQYKDADRPPPAEARRALDFDRAVLRRRDSAHVLTVSGIKPHTNMPVRLEPRVYTRLPEYWGIMVVGFVSRVARPRAAPYLVSLSLAGTMGTVGVEVMGATRSERLDAPLPSLPNRQVIAEGTLERPGITSYQYGTHVLRGPAFYALRSTSRDLDRYVGRSVRLSGFLVTGYPIEGGPSLVDVEWVQVRG